MTPDTLDCAGSHVRAGACREERRRTFRPLRPGVSTDAVTGLTDRESADLDALRRAA
ncbi:hypothetical protein [Streptomyces sp. NPDC046821]|uniref:hypothetical protein n=1 Tax=Streptomyces sp. NPDC046821 TaxID=3154702 RepID=UPI0033DEFC27